MKKHWIIIGLSIGTLAVAFHLWRAVGTPPTHDEPRWVTSPPITRATIRGETVEVPQVPGIPERKPPSSRPGLPASTRLMPGQDGIAAPVPGT